MNLAFGANLVQSIVNNSQSQWKSTLIKKYLSGRIPVRLEYLMGRDKCTNIWILCKASAPIIMDNLTQLPSNGKDINLQTDNYCGMSPLQNHAHLSKYKNGFCPKTFRLSVTQKIGIISQVIGGTRNNSYLHPILLNLMNNSFIY